MTYATLMVHVQLGDKNGPLLEIAGSLAERFQSAVIGIAACQPMQIVYGDGYYTGDFLDKNREDIERDLKAAETEFNAALRTRINTIEWRSTVTLASLSGYLAEEARCADLLITNVDQNASFFDPSRHVNTDDLVMQAGRPVLIVPTGTNTLKLDHVLVGWKDTREARRAIVDALPFLKRAVQVTVVEIAAEDDLPDARARLADVMLWLKRQGVAAEAVASASTGDDSKRLNAIALEHGADLLVAGAYGHSRVREWVLGGVTRDLLLRADRCSLVSH